MPKISRRNLIAGATAGAATVGVFAAVPLKMLGQHTPPAAATNANVGPMMVYVTDPTSAQITLLVSDKEITFRDADLVARLVQAAQR